ncbi:transporter substrate-binding domain-containing protein [Arsenophonus nasoniae]|uniref:Cyclohexadienyl dehydratase n=2 Tax=Arsenophonus nasoniae TaxID=638 RepID=D2TYG2_9GAMM|nr:cyclohexadienyl dehydratase [Arsenophonus nasoniae]
MMKKLTVVSLVFLSAAAQAQSHLDRVMKSKTLTVCATGDYRPYTHLLQNGQYEGIDVTMMENLAASLGAKVKWQKTTWNTLMTDFHSKQCDIAVGGISVTLKRQQATWLSAPLAVDGKIPLVRCDDKAKYQTIEQLNKPTVRLIAPFGGTNEAFAHRYLPNAQLQLTHDNAAIFQQIIDKKFDVMVTDASEALYQQKHYPTKLCALNPKRPLQYIEKAYMLPRDDMSWKLYVDQWIHLNKKTGVYRNIVSEWIAIPK